MQMQFKWSFCYTIDHNEHDAAFLKEEFYGRQVILADRNFVEEAADKILEDALDNDVAFLVVGDPLGLVSTLYLMFA